MENSSNAFTGSSYTNFSLQPGSSFNKRSGGNYPHFTNDLSMDDKEILFSTFEHAPNCVSNIELQQTSADSFADRTVRK